MKKTSVFPLSQKTEIAAVIIVYGIFASIFGFAYRYAMNPDGISLLRLSGYIAEGNFQQSVTHSWSPLTIWLISPFIFLGLDGLTSARIVIALCGGGLLIGSWFLSLRFELSPLLRIISLLSIALLISLWTVRFISPDVVFAALLISYIYLITDPGLLDSKKQSFLCGAAAGLSYLAHHYAMPFFSLHFPVMLFISGWSKENGFPWRKVAAAFGAGIAGFLIIASIWVGVVSVKYGRLAISSKGSIAHAAMGPADKDRRHPFFVGGLYKPKEKSASHVYEDPSEVNFETWSPFESKEYFFHQLRLIKVNLAYLLDHFVTKSPYFNRSLMIGVMAFIVISLMICPLNKQKRFLYAWFIVTFSIYCSGFLLVIAKSPRRFYAMMIIFLLLVFHFLEAFKNGTGGRLKGRGKNILVFFLIIIIVTAFTLKPGIQLFQSLKYIVNVKQINPYKEIAAQINTVDFPGPYAVVRSSQKLTTDYYINYFLGKQLLGRPLSEDVVGITRELREVEAKSLLVYDHPEIVEKLMGDKSYVHKAAIKLDNSSGYEKAADYVVRYHEIITGWDKVVNIFTVNQGDSPSR